MRLKELNGLLLKELSLFYLPQGFDLYGKASNFCKDEFRVFFGVKSKSRDSLHFNPSLVVNNTEVFNVLNELFPESANLTIVRIQGRDLARAFGCNDYDYLGDDTYDMDKGKWYQLKNENDINRIVADHSDYMRKVGFRFFDQFSTLIGISDFMNKRILEVSQETFDSPSLRKDIGRDFSSKKVISAITAAYLVEHPKIDVLLGRYRIAFDGIEYTLDRMKKIEDYFTSKS